MVLEQDASASSPGGRRPRGPATVRFEGVSKEYRSRDRSTVHALDDVTVSLQSGEFVSVVGPSGCGKSTLLRILAGLLDPTTGHVTINGDEVTGPRRDIGVVFQQPLLLPWKTVLANVMLVAKIQRLSPREIRPRALGLLSLVGLDGFQDKYPHELSGGMQQRVGVARALVNDPSLLLMDEPFGALDALTRERMGFELLRIWEQEHKTVMFVTHSLTEAVLLSDRVVCMSSRPGQVIDVIDIPIERPRKLRQMSSPEFAKALARLREVLFGIEDGEDSPIGFGD